MKIEFRTNDGLRYLTSDSHQFIINKKVRVEDKKTGERVWKMQPLSYYTTFGSALKGIAKMKLRSSDATSIEEALSYIREFHEEIDKVTKGY